MHVKLAAVRVNFARARVRCVYSYVRGTTPDGNGNGGGTSSRLDSRAGADRLLKAGDRVVRCARYHPEERRRVDLPKRPGLYDFLSERKYLQVQDAIQRRRQLRRAPGASRDSARDRAYRTDGYNPRFNVTLRRKRATYTAVTSEPP